jgi:molecular chaperone DnaJ
VDQEIDNAFAELGLTPDATEAEVKAAWRRLVSKWHPDRNGSATAVAKMQRLNRAVEAIHQAGFARTSRPPGTGPDKPRRDEASRRDAEHGDSHFDYADADERDSDDLDDGATAHRDASEPLARTINRKVRLTLEEAAFGCTKVLRGKLTQACSVCEGVGHRVLGGHCAQCHGSGATRQQSWFGWVGMQTECDACHGAGIARRVCADCAGTGNSTEQYKVTVRFPHGVRHGDLLAVDGRQGKPRSLPGNLSIRVEIQQHGLLKLDKDGTVLCDVPVDGFAWMANRSVDVPTLGGEQTIMLQRDQLSYRLPGQGFPVERRGRRGDQVITITPIFPQRMTTDQEMLLDQLIATTSGPRAKHPDERLHGWNEALQAWKRASRRRD